MQTTSFFIERIQVSFYPLKEPSASQPNGHNPLLDTVNKFVCWQLIEVTRSQNHTPTGQGHKPSSPWQGKVTLETIKDRGHSGVSACADYRSQQILSSEQNNTKPETIWKNSNNFGFLSQFIMVNNTFYAFNNENERKYFIWGQREQMQIIRILHSLHSPLNFSLPMKFMFAKLYWFGVCLYISLRMFHLYIAGM